MRQREVHNTFSVHGANVIVMQPLPTPFPISPEIQLPSSAFTSEEANAFFCTHGFETVDSEYSIYGVFWKIATKLTGPESFCNASEAIRRVPLKKIVTCTQFIIIARIMCCVKPLFYCKVKFKANVPFSAKKIRQVCTTRFLGKFKAYFAPLQYIQIRHASPVLQFNIHIE